MKKFLSVFTILTILTTLTSLPSRAGTTGTDMAPLPFTDVSDNIHLKDILELSSRGVVQGYDDGTFKPDQTINRAEFLKILTETKGDYTPSKDTSDYDILTPVGLNFKDIRSKQWYVPYIRNALKLQIIAGYPDGTFRPTDPINLAEALKITYLMFKIPTVQFIREPDHWYDYYTTGLDADFTTKTQLDPIKDIDKKITRGEMASLALYFEAKAKLLIIETAPPVIGPFFVDKPLILEKHYDHGTWTLKGFVMFSNGCYKAQAAANVLPSQPETVTLTLTEVSDQLGMCLPTPQEQAITFTFSASDQAHVSDVTINGKTITTVIHDPDQEINSTYSPITVQRSETKNATLLDGTFQVQGCVTPSFTTTIYDGTHQQAEIDITLSDDSTGRRCSRTFNDFPINVSVPYTGNQSTVFRARINGEPVQLIIQ